MEIIIKKDEYFDKIALNDILDSIPLLVNKIQKNYNELIKSYKNYFVFPNEDYKNIFELIRTLKNQSSVTEEEYESLTQQLKDFSTKIKESSYENTIMSNIRENNNELKELNNKICLMQFNNLINKKLSTSNNLTSFEQENNNTKDYEAKFPYINDKPQTNNNENNYKISLTCSNEQCTGKVKFFCNKHCYKYFCENCKKKSDEEIYAHQFEEISEEEENQKINFINSFLYLLKFYVEKSDFIFKKCDKIKKSNYPILKDFDEFNSQIEFLSGIYNFQNRNDNNNKRHSDICEYIKNSIVKAFELDIPILNIIDDNFEDSNGDDFLNLIKDEIKKPKNENSTNMNKLNKIKIIIKNNYKKFFARNSLRYDYLADYKNIINELIDKEI